MGVGEGSMPPTPLGTVWGGRGDLQPPQGQIVLYRTNFPNPSNTNPVLMHCNYNQELKVYTLKPKKGISLNQTPCVKWGFVYRLQSAQQCKLV